MKCDADGRLYVECNCGKHLLIDDEGLLAGVYPMGNKEPNVHFEGKYMLVSEWLAKIACGKGAVKRGVRYFANESPKLPPDPPIRGESFSKYRVRR